MSQPHPPERRPPATTPPRTEFEQLAEEKPLSLPHEFLLFIRENKAWWMVPILLVLALLGTLAWFAGTGAAPFIYTLF